MSDTDSLLVSDENGIRIITLNRPHRKNALDTAVSAKLRAALVELDQRADLHVGVITGTQGTFCSGMDLTEFAASGFDREKRGRGTGFQLGLIPQIATPVIAAVEGYAIGGGFELALACDMIVAAVDSTFALPEVHHGLFAGGGGLKYLASTLPPGLAKELAFTGRPISGTEAAEVGLVTHAVPAGMALDDAVQLAGAITAGGPLGVRASKQLLDRAINGESSTFLELQAQLIRRVFTSNDAREGAAAFVDRRAPRWTGS